MEVWREIRRGTLRGIVEKLFFCAMFALPWIYNIRAATFLFIATGGLLILSGDLRMDYSWYRKQALFLLFLAYYLFQVVALCFYPHDVFVHADLEKKASLIVIPLLLYVLLTTYKDAWKMGVAGFIYGNTFAALCCFIMAIARFAGSKNADVFFYHQYAHVTGLNAIYFSFYLLVTLGYIVINNTFILIRWLTNVVVVFLYLNLLLLSSKMMIVAGTLLLIASLLRSVKPRWQKMAILSGIACISVALASTGNPIRKRYADVNIHNYSLVFNTRDFTDYSFDGLSIRLALWRLGNELVNERHMWLFGAGGDRYQPSLNSKIKRYGLYSGDSARGDKGYQNYNMHNQYMESYLQFGIAGVVTLLSILTCVIYYATRSHNGMMIYTGILFSVAFLTESVLETQAGILLFTIIISGEWIQSQMNKQSALN